MKIVLKLLKTIPFVLILLVAGWLNFSLYYEPEFKNETGFVYNSDLLKQLRFLKGEMQNQIADEMQHIYPEGFFFMNVTYGLSWCGFAKSIPDSSALYREAMHEINRAYNEIDSEKARIIFQDPMAIPNGAFYSGWRNYLLAQKLSLIKPSKRDSAEIRLFESQCDLIANGLFADGTPFPESYAGMAWPADGASAVAALAIHDKILTPRYQKTIETWVRKVKNGLDPNGLIPHEWDPLKNEIAGHARGSSQSLILIFLHDIDSAFGRQQFEIYKQKFLAYRWGLPGIREYPETIQGGEDVDSGPIVFGIGGSASVVAEKTMALYGEQAIAIGLRNSIEGFACGIKSGDEKKFLFGKWPVADAFIVWTVAGENSPENALRTNENWRWQFQLYSGIVMLICGAIVFLIWRKKA